MNYGNEAGSGSALGAGVSGSRIAAIEPARITQTQAAIEQLANVTASLERLSSNLEQRLCGVLRATPPMAETANKHPREVVVPVAEVINAHRENLEATANRIDSMLSRMEL